MSKPSASEYIPVAKRYVDLVPEGNFLEQLSSNKQLVVDFFSAIPTVKHEYRYAEGKWTPKEMLLHIADAERVFSYRALTLARGDREANFPNMDESLFAENVDVSRRTLVDIINEFAAVRDASFFLFNNLTSAQLHSEGNLFGHPVTPYGFGYILIGHTLHHLNIMRERYMK